MSAIDLLFKDRLYLEDLNEADIVHMEVNEIQSWEISSKAFSEKCAIRLIRNQVFNLSDKDYSGIRANGELISTMKLYKPYSYELRFVECLAKCFLNDRLSYIKEVLEIGDKLIDRKDSFKFIDFFHRFYLEDDPNPNSYLAYSNQYIEFINAVIIASSNYNDKGPSLVSIIRRGLLSSILESNGGSRHSKVFLITRDLARLAHYIFHFYESIYFYQGLKNEQEKFNL